MTGILNIIAGSGQVKNITPDVEYLVVAGGGGTASGAAGGGGAGGVRTATGYAITPNSAITVTVGAAGSTFSNGSNSVFGTVISTGGGSGGPQEYGAPGNGGSGGGAGINSYIGGSGTGGSGIAGQGYAVGSEFQQPAGRFHRRRSRQTQDENSRDSRAWHDRGNPSRC